MKKQLLFLFSILLFGTVSSQNTKVFQDTIPFRNDLGLIIIPITFNGVEKQFAFDTGAQHSVAYSWAKEILKSTNKTITVNSSSGLRSKMRFYKSGTIELGSRKIKGHRILNAPKSSIFSCYQVDGILGVDIIKELNWTIDYKNKILIMYPTNHFPKKVEKMHPLDFDFRNNRPVVFLKVKSNRLQFLLDTGAGGFSNVSRRNYNLTNFDELPQTSFYSGSFDVNGILTASQPKIFQFQNVMSKNVAVSPLMYYNNQKSSKIGNKLWKEKELFLSLKKDQLYVSSSVINQTYRSFSCSVMYSKGTMRIMRIEVESDIWNLGVRQGDEVLLFDGKKFTDFCSLDQYQRKIVRSRKSFEIQLANGKIITISKNSTLK
tara:strand:+ start:1930 stop:3054 length:1125 start_codon:yes stop_codon:yes gene_type:complete